MHYNLALIGFGNVARALARLLVRKRDFYSSHNTTSPFRLQAFPQGDMVLQSIRMDSISTKRSSSSKADNPSFLFLLSL